MEKKTRTFVIVMVLGLLSIAFNRGSAGMPQTPDVIWIGDNAWSLMGKPLWDADSLAQLAFEDMLPRDKVFTSSNFSGYTAHWSLRDSHLYLDSVDVDIAVGDMRGKVVYYTDDLLEAFSIYHHKGAGIRADWMNDTIRAARGDTVLYVPDMWHSRLADEHIIVLQNGRVLQDKEYHNRHVPGINSETLAGRVSADFPWALYPQLSKMACAVDIASVTAEGRPEGISLVLLSPEMPQEETPQIEQAIAAIISESYPLDRLCICDQWSVYPPGTIYLRIRR